MTTLLKFAPHPASTDRERQEATAPNGAAVDDAKEALKAARREYVSRRDRERYFGPDLFADPAWDILIDLFIAVMEGRDVPVTNACIASHVPLTTALRYVNQLQAAALVERVPHPTDRRCSNLRLTPFAVDRMIKYFITSDLRRRL